MKILMLAWRDLKNPKMGGAEIVTDKYLAGLSKLGHDVTLFSSDFGSIKNENLNNYNIIRKGGVLGVYIKGLIYAYKNRKKYDIIIDQINTIPFFTFLLIPKSKRICFFHQLCQNVWFYESPWFISWLGWILENIYLFFYKNTKTIVVSKSTRDDLIKRGFKNVNVITNAIDLKPISKVGVKKLNQLCYVGRLKNSKRVHEIIEALKFVKFKIPKIKLKIVGIGDTKYLKSLKELVKKYKLEKNIEFTGKVSFEKRNKIMGESMAIIVTSIREGWGLIVTEANANATTAITYNIHGLRDANRTGIITNKNTPKELSKEILKLLKNKELIEKMSIDSLKDSYKFIDWEIRIEKFEKILKK